MKILIRPKFIILSVFFFAFCLFLTDCEEEKPEPRDYPRVNTLPVSNITSEGAVFSADIYSLGTETINEYGFVWGLNNDPQLSSDKIIFPGTKIIKGVYNVEIKSSLREGVEYTVKPYILTDSHVVYGKPVIFNSLGSMAPIITGFEPADVEWGDTLKISGRNFSWVPFYNVVRLSQTECDVISATDTTLVIIVDRNLTDIKSKLSVEVAGNISIYPNKELNLLMPSILNVFPQQATWGDTITLTGEKLNPHYNNFSISISGFNCNIIEYKEDRLLFTVPNDLLTTSNEVQIRINNNIELVAPESLSLILPSITDFYPLMAEWGDTINITGKHFNTERNSIVVTIGGKLCKILDYLQDTLKIQVPFEVASITNDMKVNFNKLTLIENVPFTLLPPYITEIYPKEGTWGSTLLIKGRFHPEKSRNRITVGGTQTEILFNSRDSMLVKIGYGVISQANLVRNVVAPFNIAATDTFRILPPYIESITPDSGPVGTYIKIRGKYFFCQYYYQTLVRFGSEPGLELSVSDSVITCRVPYMDNGLKNVTVQVNSIKSVHNDGFNVKNPVITSVYPINGYSDDEITIEGENFLFNGFKTYVLFETSRSVYEAKIVFVSESKIIAKVPTIPANSYRIAVSLGTVTIYSSFVFDLSNPK